MPRKVKYPTDDKCERMVETRVWRVLEEFSDEYGGNGLTANALCYLTKQPWRIVREVILRPGQHQIAVMYCGEVKAPVFYPTYLRDELTPSLYAQYASNMQNLKKADAIIAKYPPPDWQGATENKGEKTLTYFMFLRGGGLSDDEDYDWCGDPTCCPPPKAREQKDLFKESKKLSIKLRQAWRA